MALSNRVSLLEALSTPFVMRLWLHRMCMLACLRSWWMTWPNVCTLTPDFIHLQAWELFLWITENAIAILPPDSQTKSVWSEISIYLNTKIKAMESTPASPQLSPLQSTRASNVTRTLTLPASPASPPSPA